MTERRLQKRPVAWRVRAANGDWILYEDEEAAYRFAEATGAEMQGLYIRDGADGEQEGRDGNHG